MRFKKFGNWFLEGDLSEFFFGLVVILTFSVCLFGVGFLIQEEMKMAENLSKYWVPQMTFLIDEDVPETETEGGLKLPDGGIKDAVGTGVIAAFGEGIKGVDIGDRIWFDMGGVVEICIDEGGDKVDLIHVTIDLVRCVETSSTSDSK